MKKQQSGFTLIELIMVIVILGILSAFALPRFADLSGGAEEAAANGALGAVKSASAIAHAACLAADNTVCDEGLAASSVNLEGTAIAMVFGYPAATAAGICAAASLDAADYSCVGAGGPPVVGTITLVGSTCNFTYTAATATAAPAITPVAGC